MIGGPVELLGFVHEVFDADLLDVLIRLVGVALLAAGVAGFAAFLFRWQTGIQLPEGPGLLLGVGAVAVYLNTRIALVQFLGTNGRLLTPSAVAVNLAMFAVSGVTAGAGWYAGDRLGAGERMNGALRPSLSPLVRATGRFIAVELPEELADIDGYDPVAGSTKALLAGKTYHFSRGLTVDQLEEALATRLKTDHNISHVDVELTGDGDVEYLAVGRRATGIGPTLSPGESATAIRADPAFSASPGDTIQLWDGAGARRLGTAELRATAGETVTVSARRDIVESLDPTERYRLLTLAADERVDRTFAGMLRRADETMGIAEVTEGATLAGLTVGDLGLSVVAIGDESGAIETIPARDRTLAAGDQLYVIGHPAQLRRVDAAASGEAGYERPTPAAPDDGHPGKRSRWRFR